MDKVFIPEPKLDGKTAEQIGAAIIKIVNDKDKEIITLTSDNRCLRNENTRLSTTLKRVMKKYNIDFHCGNCKMAAFGKKDKEDWLHDEVFCDGDCPE